MTFPEEIEEMKEPNSEASQSTPADHEERIKSMLEEVALHIHQTYLDEEDASHQHCQSQHQHQKSKVPSQRPAATMREQGRGRSYPVSSLQK